MEHLDRRKPGRAAGIVVACECEHVSLAGERDRRRLDRLGVDALSGCRVTALKREREQS